jgi:hypothetical protein
MLKRSTWVLLAILALVIAAYFLIKDQSSKPKTLTPTPAGAKLLISPADGVLQSLRISDSKGNNFQMQRDLSKAWVITAPASGAADQGLAGAAETQVGALSIVTTLETPPDLNVLGLSAPMYSIEVGFVGGSSHKIEVGNLTPTSSGYYVRFDGGKIYVVANSGIDAVVKLLTAPPFPATATPIPTPESTATPTP